MSYVLGIDGGGTKTVCLLTDDIGKIWGRGEAGASNYQSVGIQAAFDAIEAAIAQAIIPMGTVKVAAICLGLAGVNRPADIAVAQGFVHQLQLSPRLPITWDLQPARILVTNDALIALVGGLGHDVGIVAIAGTGSVIFGRNSQGCTQKVGGWGYLLGDEGSAYDIAISAMKAALKAYDGRESPTSLQESFLQHLHLKSIEELVEVVYQRGWGVKEIAALAPLVDRAALAGDQVANTILEQAVQELVKSTQTVINSIFNQTETIEIVTTGSVWQSLSKLRERFQTSILAIAPNAQVKHPMHEPAYGAALYALINARTGYYQSIFVQSDDR